MDNINSHYESSNKGRGSMSTTIHLKFHFKSQAGFIYRCGAFLFGIAADNGHPE